MARRRFRIRFRKRVNIPRVVAKVTGVVLALYVGGTILTEIGSVMNGTCSSFYKGLTLIGWTVGTSHCTDTSASNDTTISATSGTGILSVVGIVGIASVIMEFVTFSL